MSPVRRNEVRRDRGAVAVEFGLLLPLLMLIVMGIIDFGRMLNAQETLTQAAREGARLASFGESNGDITTRTRQAGSSLCPDDGACINVAPTSCPGDDGTVSVTYEFTFATPVGAFGAMFGGGGYGDPIDMTAKGVMPCET